MKIRTAKYIIKEGLLNAYRNKLMFLASVSIVTASLVIFGISLLLAINLNSNMQVFKDQPEIEVFCDPDLDNTQVAQVEDTVKKDEKVESYKVVTKKEAFAKAKEIVGSDEDILQGLDENFLPVAFVIKLKDPNDSESTVEQYKKVDGVENVTFSQKTIDFISKITYWMRMVSILLIAILLAISIFIISNTIKLTVFARRKEINIMKYIGATDWFIRWPFIVEGVIIGFSGSIIAFVLVSYSYTAVESKVNNDLLQFSINFFKFVKMNQMGIQIMGIFALIGIVVGALGSIISIRKYLHV